METPHPFLYVRETPSTPATLPYSRFAAPSSCTHNNNSLHCLDRLGRNLIAACLEPVYISRNVWFFLSSHPPTMCPFHPFASKLALVLRCALGDSKGSD
eukprot:748448-Hanusia_phi.AAC.5